MHHLNIILIEDQVTKIIQTEDPHLIMKIVSIEEIIITMIIITRITIEKHLPFNIHVIFQVGKNTPSKTIFFPQRVLVIFGKNRGVRFFFSFEVDDFGLCEFSNVDM